MSAATGSSPVLAQDETIQLTDAILANLTSLELTNISLFAFEDEKTGLERRTVFGKCKTAPGDFWFPGTLIWKIFDILVGGALQKTVPYASVCYEDFDNYDQAKCDYITNNWFNGSYIQYAVSLHPHSCMPLLTIL